MLCRLELEERSPRFSLNRAGDLSRWGLKSQGSDREGNGQGAQAGKKGERRVVGGEKTEQPTSGLGYWGAGVPEESINDSESCYQWSCSVGSRV